MNKIFKKQKQTNKQKTTNNTIKQEKKIRKKN